MNAPGHLEPMNGLIEAPPRDRKRELMLLKLRQDYKQQQGKAFSLRTFHDTLLGNGTLPLWLHRALMLGENSGDMIE